jgi:hypothetical protein
MRRIETGKKVAIRAKFVDIRPGVLLNWRQRGLPCAHDLKKRAQKM